MRPRIEDVAAIAGVSTKTVSRVLNREPNVSEQTRVRVETAMRGLNYVPHPSARALAAKRSYVLGLIYDTPSGDYLMQVQDGVLEACRAQGYNTMLWPVSYGRSNLVDELGALIARSRCDGVVLAPPLTDDAAFIELLALLAVPHADVSPRVHGRLGAYVDERAAVRALVGHLVALGHRRIGHVRGRATHGASEIRLAGYRDALEAAGIAFAPELVLEGDFTHESGFAAAQALLSLPEPPTAIFAANDDSACGVLRAAAMRGLEVPRDLSICGFDDDPIARRVFPRLTTVRQPTQEMGRVAAEQLLMALRDPAAGGMVQLEFALRLRESTAAPRR
jgi:LacI family transcriptional regulator